MIESLVTHPTISVQHIFVANFIQRLLLRYAAKKRVDRAIIERARTIMHQPNHGPPHRSHFHVRIFCAEDDKPDCIDKMPFYAWHPRDSSDANATADASSTTDP